MSKRPKKSRGEQRAAVVEDGGMEKELNNSYVKTNLNELQAPQ